MSVEMIPIMVLMAFTGKTFSYISDVFLIYELIYDCIVFLCLYLWLKKKKLILAKTELGIWERRMLNGNGLLLFIIYCLVTSIPDSFSDYQRYILAGGSIITVMIIVTSIIMIFESNNATYYKLMAEINEHYLEAQLNHFKAYQDTQQETRRIRHDMKNHMICAMDIFSRGEYEMLGDYLKELSELTQNIDKCFHIGNDISDSIINEKYSASKSKNIEFAIEGTMAGINSIAPIDICTIFANAIDNAVEEIVREEYDNAVISISVKRDRRFLLISFSNPCRDNVSVDTLKTQKRDTLNHGFGIENMKLAAEKYKGNIKCHTEKNELGQNQFSLDIMLMV